MRSGVLRLKGGGAAEVRNSIQIHLSLLIIKYKILRIFLYCLQDVFSLFL